MLGALTVKQVGISNKENLMRIIMQAAPCSRGQLAKASGLSIMTVKNIVDSLLQSGVIQERKTEAAIGRKPLHVSFATTLGNVLCIDVSSPLEITAACFTLGGACLFETKQITDESISYRENMRLLVNKAKAEAGNILGVGVSVAGVYCPEADSVPNDLIKEYSNIRFKALLKEFFPDINIFAVVQDVRLAASNEAKLRGTQNLAYLYFGAGVGSYIIINGVGVGEKTTAAGEIGSMITEDGNLQGLLSSMEISQKHGKGFSALWKDYEQAEPKAVATIQLAGKTVCRLVYNLIFLLNPEHIVIDSDKRIYANYLQQQAQAFCNKNVPKAYVPAEYTIETAKNPRKSVYGGLFDVITDLFISTVCEQ